MAAAGGGWKGMNRYRHMFAICLAALLFLCFCRQASSDAAFLTGLDLSSWLTDPYALDISLQERIHLPLDEERTDELNRLLNHAVFRLEGQSLGDDTWSSMALLIDDAEVLRLVQCENGHGSTFMTSQEKNQAFSSREGSAISLFFGLDQEDISIMGLRGDEALIFEEADHLLEALRKQYPDKLKGKKEKQRVTGYGSTTRRETLTLKAEDAPQMAELLLAVCPEGKLKELLQGVTFTGKQQLDLLVDDQDQIIKVSYTGRCGIPGDIRKVTLSWRRKRTNDSIRDSLSLKTPAVSGNNLTNIKLVRELKIGSALSTLSLTLDSSIRKDGHLQTLDGSCELQAEYSGVITKLTGHVELTRTGVAEGKETCRIIPDLNIDVSRRLLDGQISYQKSESSHIVSDRVLALTLTRPDDQSWSMPSAGISLDAMTDEEISRFRDAYRQVWTSELIRRLALLPEEDSIYLSRELDHWEQIVQAAQSAMDREDDVP